MLRTFRSPSGREWKASVFELPPQSTVLVPLLSGQVRKILCFEARDIALELTEFPENWAELPDADLVALLRTATLPSVVVGRPVQPSPRLDERPVRC